MLTPTFRMTTRPAVPIRHIRLPRAEVWLCLPFVFQVAHAEPTRINGRVVAVADGISVIFFCRAPERALWPASR